MYKFNKNRLEKFSLLLEFFKANKREGSSAKHKSYSFNDYNIFYENLKKIENEVFKQRRDEAKKMFEEKKDTIKISSFELMEHDFRENSHTNILQYLFDFRFSGKLGATILKSVINSIEKPIAKKITSSIENCTYSTERESPTKDGRIDLLIVDDLEKFVIVIENKILSNIIKKNGENDFEAKENQQIVTKTQLTNYKQHVSKKYSDYNTLFILLSYTSQDILDDDFVFLNYEFLYEVLKKIEFYDNVLFEYKLLLESLLNIRIDKLAALELGYKFFIGKPKKLPTFYELNTIKTTFYA